MSARGRRPASIRRWLTVAAGILLLAAGGWWLSRATQADGDGATRWAEVRRGDLVVGIEVSGKLRALDTSSLGPPPLREYWEFKIAQMTPEGEEVREGTPVLSFDTSELQQQLLQQQAEADQARKQIEKTEETLAMNRRLDQLKIAEAEARLRKARLVTELPGELAKAQELALARLDLELAEKEVAHLTRRLEASDRSAEAQLAALRNQRERAEQKVLQINAAMEQMVRKAPRDGTVVYVTDWQDNKKKVGDTCWRNQSVIELPDLSAMKGEGEVDESEASLLAAGQRVTLHLDAHPDVEFTGRVASIWKTVQRKSWRNPLKVARFEIELDETDTRRMRPGMRFRGQVEAERITDALLVPVEAVVPHDGGPRVWRRTFTGRVLAPVELGRQNDRFVEVLGGLEEGEQVALAGGEGAGA